MPFLRLFARRVYLAVANMTWSALGLAVLLHFLVSLVLLALAGEAFTGDAVTFLYFYVTTATTVGYGDLSPATAWGRVFGALFVLPGAIAAFTAVLGKAVADLGNYWRRAMNGLGDYSTRTGHTVVLGWQGVRTRRLIELLRADQPEDETIVLIAKSVKQNPMPEELDFVRADALSTPRGLERAGVAGARAIVIRGEDDDETLAATLATASAAPKAHIVAHFEDERAAELIQRQCPEVEAIGSLSAELLVRSSRDPGASRVADLLFSAKTEDTAFSAQVPQLSATLTYGDVFAGLKREHDATLVGIGTGDLGHGGEVDLNCPGNRPVAAGETVFYIADGRLESDAIRWKAFGPHTSLQPSPRSVA